MDMLIVLLILCLFVQQLMFVLSNKSLAFKKIQYPVYIIILSFIAVCAKAKYQSKAIEDSERENVIFFVSLLNKMIGVHVIFFLLDYSTTDKCYLYLYYYILQLFVLRLVSREKVAVHVCAPQL